MEMYITVIIIISITLFLRLRYNNFFLKIYLVGYTAAHILPRTSDISVSAVEAELQHYMESQCLNSLLIPDRPISAVLSFITTNSCAALRNSGDNNHTNNNLNKDMLPSPGDSPLPSLPAARLKAAFFQQKVPPVFVATIVGDGDSAFQRLVENIYNLVKAEKLPKESSHGQADTTLSSSKTDSGDRSGPVPLSPGQGQGVTTLGKDPKQALSSEPFAGSYSSLSTLAQPAYSLSSMSFQSTPTIAESSHGGDFRQAGRSTSKQNIQMQKAQLLDKEISLTSVESENAKLKEEIQQLKAAIEVLRSPAFQAVNQEAATNNNNSNLNKEKERELLKEKITKEVILETELKFSSEIDGLKAELSSLVTKNKSLKSKIAQVKEEVDSLERDKRVLQYENGLMKQEIVKLKEQLAYQAEQNSHDRK